MTSSCDSLISENRGMSATPTSIIVVGEELCKRLSQMSAKLILSSRNEERLKEVLNDLSHPENARYYVNKHQYVLY